jgi:hypothetical protein
VHVVIAPRKDRAGKGSDQPAPADPPAKSKDRFDRTAYQRDYMRKRRQKDKQQG